MKTSIHNKFSLLYYSLSIKSIKLFKDNFN